MQTELTHNDMISSYAIQRTTNRRSPQGPFAKNNKAVPELRTDQQKKRGPRTMACSGLRLEEKTWPTTDSRLFYALRDHIMQQLRVYRTI